MVAVVHVDQHGIQHHPAAAALPAAAAGGAAAALVALVQRLGRHREDLPDLAGPAPAFAAEGREVGRHARLDPADVGFRNLGPDGHRRQFGDPQDQRGLLLGIEGLAFARIDRHHRAGHRRVDAGIAEFGFVAAQRGLGLADLRLVHLDPCLGGEHLRLGALHVLGTRRAAGGQPLLALVLLAGEGVLGTLLGQLGLEHLDRIAAGIDLGLLGGGVDLDQQLAFRHIVPGLDVQLADLPGGLGADVDVAPRLQGAERRDAALDAAAADTHGIEAVAAERIGLPGGQGDQGAEADCDEQCATSTTGSSHSGIRPVRGETAAAGSAGWALPDIRGQGG